ncbi:MAG: precorrin-2 C(20)-methyltransferase [Actinomycetota bacterium]|nr:precorrin-2 C(20)-methyltransferase [Actinomycetota bacterium]
MSAHRLVGVGVGPGDPELVTVKGVRVLREADVVLVPVMGDGASGQALPGRAEATVRAHVDAARVRRAVFALDERAGVTPRREAAWDAAAAAVMAGFDEGAATVAFATIGDPNVYSTFTYLAATVQRSRSQVQVETVPGVTAVQDLAARSGTVLTEGEESLALLPLTRDLGDLRAALDRFDTVVAYKGGRRLPEVLDVVREAGRLAETVYGAALGLPDERIAPAASLEGAGPYLSTLIVTRARSGRGSRL